MKEHGIRMALGAQPLEVMRSTLRRPVLLLLCGSSAGIVGGLLTSRFLAHLNILCNCQRSSSDARSAAYHDFSWIAGRLDPRPASAGYRSISTASRVAIRGDSLAFFSGRAGRKLRTVWGFTSVDSAKSGEFGSALANSKLSAACFGLIV